MEDDPIGFPAPLWKQLGELGVTGLTLPEAYGGGGQSALEAMIVYEELGRALAPSPHFVSAVLAAGVIARGGTEAQKREWLPKIASGEAIVTPAWLEPRGGYGPLGVQLTASGSGGNAEAHRRASATCSSRRPRPGSSCSPRSGTAATDVDLLLVDPTAPGVTLTQQKTMAVRHAVRGRRSATSRSPRPSASARARGGWALWNDVMHAGIILLAAQAMGGAERALEITVDYAKTRHQFDKPLGAFQALAHYLGRRRDRRRRRPHARPRGGVGARERAIDRASSRRWRSSSRAGPIAT